jgi:hypothetical protein
LSTLIAFALIVYIIHLPQVPKGVYNFLHTLQNNPTDVTERILQEYVQSPEAYLFNERQQVQFPPGTANEIFFVLPYQSIVFLAIICGSTLNASSVS